jgi:mannitol operon transcriptional antiterminator
MVGNMDELTIRQKFILKSLIVSHSLNIKELSAQMDVSERTILREVASVNSLFKPDNIKVTLKNSFLILLGDDEKLKKLEKSLGSIPKLWLLTPDQRIIFITAQLLLANEPYKSALFSYQMNVVEGTISLYMDKIEKWLAVRNLFLNRKRGYGIEINGSDWDKRNALIELTFEFKSAEELLAYIYETKVDTALHSYFDILFGKKVVETSKEIMGFVSDESIISDDIEYLTSLIYVAISVKKTNENQSISFSQEFIEEIFSEDDSSFLFKLQTFLQELDVSDNEIAYIYIHLPGNKYTFDLEKKFEELGASIEKLCEEVVGIVEEKSGDKINCDSQLFYELSHQLNSAIYRNNMGIQLKNPLTSQVQEHYGDLFNIVEHACKLEFSKYNIKIPKDEIAYITLHIGAARERTKSGKNRISALIVCQNAIGAARMLSNRLKSVIPEIDKVDTKSLRDLTESSEQYDIILSTVHIDLNDYTKENVIFVSPFLDNEDITKINNFIKRLKGNRDSLNDAISLTQKKSDQNAEEEKFEIINKMMKTMQIETISAETFEKMIDIITSKIYAKRQIADKEEIERLILKREKMGSVVISNTHVALLHTRSDSIFNPFIGIYRLRKSMTVNNARYDAQNVDTFIVLLARKNELPYVLEKIGNISISLIEDKSFTEKLRIGGIKDVRSEIVTILNKVFD